MISYEQTDSRYRLKGCHIRYLASFIFMYDTICRFGRGKDPTLVTLGNIVFAYLIRKTYIEEIYTFKKYMGLYTNHSGKLNINTYHLIIRILYDNLFLRNENIVV